MYTIYKRNNGTISFIPENIMEESTDYIAQEGENVTLCCNFLSYDYAVSDNEVLIELKWTYGGCSGFWFSTYHMLNEEFLELLESVRAINRLDGRAELLALSSYEYDICFRKRDSGYVVTKIDPQDESYFYNIRAFYDPIDVLSNLRDQAFKSARLPDASQCVILQFLYPSEGELVYSPWISAEILKHESLRYDVDTDTYRFCASIGRVDAFKDNFIFLHLCGVENVYNIRIKYSNLFKHLLARIGVIKADGTICLESDDWYSAKFEVIFRKFGAVYQCINLRILNTNASGYWAYLIHLAEAERESKNQ